MPYLKILFLILAPAWTAEAVVHKIVQKDKKFDHAELTIKVGESISFENAEADVPHNVFSQSDKNAFELKTQTPGAASVVPFNEEGVTEVECAIHSSMKLTVRVTK